MATPNYTELVDRARHAAPVIAGYLDNLQSREATVIDTIEAWDELIRLADDRRVGAKEASEMLDVEGPNLYQTLKGPDAMRVFGKPVEPVDILAGGAVYRAREIEQLGRALAASRALKAAKGDKRRRRRSPQPGEAQNAAVPEDAVQG